MPTPRYLLTTVSKRLLKIVRIMMKFAFRIVKDLEAGTLLDDYSEEEYPLPSALKERIKKNAINLQHSSLMERYLYILTQHDRIDKLINSYMNAFINHGHLYTDVDFLEWGITCCVISAKLYEKNFTEDPDIAIETVRGISSMHNKYDVFRKIGCDI